MKGPQKRRGKQERMHQVLLGLVEAYLSSGKPIGSNTLKNLGFDALSSATIRNYFMQLESDGYLEQLHSSGGRIPTSLAYRAYADAHIDESKLTKAQQRALEPLGQGQEREVTVYLEEAADLLSGLTHTAAFLSAPRFDHDLISDVKLVDLDRSRCLAIMLTEFGVVRTESLRLSDQIPMSKLGEVEAYFRWRLRGSRAPEGLSPDEEAYAQDLYNEAMLRYVVGYSHFSDEEIYRTGFSQLLDYPDCSDVTVLAKSLALFENLSGMRLLLRDCCASGQIKCWVGEELAPYAPSGNHTAVLAVPYRIAGQSVGAIGILGPQRVPYRELSAMLRHASEKISQWLTAKVGRQQLTYRQPRATVLQLPQDETALLTDQRKKK